MNTLTRAQLEEMLENLTAQASQQYEQWTLTRGAIQLCDYWLQMLDEPAGDAAEPLPADVDQGESEDDRVSSD